jgi:hypothetical protein
MKAAFSFVLAALLAAGAATVFADLYRWVDQNGNVQYSDKPPPAGARVQDQQQIKKKAEKKGSGAAGKTAPKTAAVPAGKTVAEQEAEFRKRQVEKSEKEAAAQKAKDDAAAKQRNCASAKANVAALQTGRASRPNARGEAEYLDDKQTAEEMKFAQQAVKDWCK